MNRKLIVLACTLLLFAPAICSAQLDTAWIRYSATTGTAHDVALDAAGNIYVAGSIRFIKYTPSGDVIWDTDIAAGGGGPFRIHFGAPGEVYTSGAITVRKRGVDGSLSWVRSYFDIGARAQTADLEGYFYVTGTGGTRRHLPDGTFWTQFGGAGSRIAVDDGRNMYVMRGSASDFVLTKLDSTGGTRWERMYNGPGNSTDDAIELQLDESANSYVTGKSIGSGTGYDYATIKYDTAGDLRWIARYTTPGNVNDVPVDLEVDRHGFVYVLGSSALVRYDSSGNELWAFPFAGWTGMTPVAMKPDTTGNSYVIGSIGTANNYDFMTLCISPAGMLRGIHRFDQTPGTNDVPYAINVSAGGEVYVTGGKTQSGITRFITIKYQFDECADGDADSDGYCDSVDNCPLSFNPTQTDLDADGIGDSCETCQDIDGDGFGYPMTLSTTCGLDNCPTLYNPGQQNTDGDGKGDDCDNCTDSDGDGYGDPGFPLNTCPPDNCPSASNIDQWDIDSDGVGDVCDSCVDSDGDGFGDPEYAGTCQVDNCPALFNADQQDCLNNGDPVADGAINVLDVVRCVDYAFRNQLPQLDSNCAAILLGGTDVDCDGATTVLDVVKLIGVAFRNAPDDLCRPCQCDCYPESCGAADTADNLLANNGSFEKYCLGTIDGWYSNDGVLVNIAAPGAGRWGILSNCQLGCHPPWGMVAILTETLPEGIYLFSIAYRSIESGNYGEISYEYGSEYGQMWIETEDTAWTTISFVDTLSAQEPAPSYFYFYIWGNGYYDAAAVRYLGPVTL